MAYAISTYSQITWKHGWKGQFLQKASNSKDSKLLYEVHVETRFKNQWVKKNNFNSCWEID